MQQRGEGTSKNGAICHGEDEEREGEMGETGSWSESSVLVGREDVGMI